MPYVQPGGVAIRVAYRRVQYAQCNVRVLYRLGAQGADPDRWGASGKLCFFSSTHGERLLCKGETRSSSPRTNAYTHRGCGAPPK